MGLISSMEEDQNKWKATSVVTGPAFQGAQQAPEASSCQNLAAVDDLVTGSTAGASKLSLEF